MKKSNLEVLNYFKIFVSLNIIFYSAIQILGYYNLDLSSIPNTVKLLFSIFYQVFIFLSPLYILKAKKNEFGLKSFNFIKCIWAIFKAYVMIILFNLIIYYFKLDSLIPGLGKQDDMISGIIETQSDKILLGVSICLIAPLLEEIIFRGYIYGKLKQNYSVIKSSIITSLLFSTLHLQFNVVISMFIISMVIHSVREETQSTWPAIIFHSLNNSLAFFMLIN